MGKLAASHSDPNPFNRKPKKGGKNRVQLYKQVDELVDLLYYDICNGLSRSEIIQKLMQGLYDGHKAKSHQQAYNYLEAAENRVAFNKMENEQALKATLYTRYEALLEQAIKDGDNFLGKSILDSMSRLCISNTPNTAVQINSGNEKLEVKFGFSE